jgi:nucleoside-diphosphate kinase
METIERTLVLVKPDGVERGLVGSVLHRIERVGLTLAAVESRAPDRDLVAAHYDDLADEPFYDDLVDYVTGGPVVAAVFEGVEAVTEVRKLVGETAPQDAAPGTIRGDFAHVSYGHADTAGKPVKNLVHASEPGSAEKELDIWFPDREFLEVERVDTAHTQ